VTELKDGGQPDMPPFPWTASPCPKGQERNDAASLVVKWFRAAIIPDS
jgi:hypothetical protein